jgi:hypothetical protein
MFCHKCGHKSPEGSMFCQKCGERLIQGDARQSETPNVGHTPEQGYISGGDAVKSISSKLNKKMLIAGGGVILFLTILTLIVIAVTGNSYDDDYAEDYSYTPAPAQMQTYTNAAEGISFEYPAEWTAGDLDAFAESFELSGEDKLLFFFENYAFQDYIGSIYAIKTTLDPWIFDYTAEDLELLFGAGFNITEMITTELDGTRAVKSTLTGNQDGIPFKKLVYFYNYADSSYLVNFESYTSNFDSNIEVFDSIAASYTISAPAYGTTLTAPAPDALAGEWFLTNANVQGTIMTTEELATRGADFSGMFFNFLDAKNVELTDEVGEIAKGTYVFTEDIITISDSGAETVTADFLETEIHMDAGDGVILIFERNTTNYL